MRTELAALPLAARWALIAAVVAGGIGLLAGLIVGLFVYAPTAPFAAVELGFPAALAGALLGALGGGIATARRGAGGSGPDAG